MSQTLVQLIVRNLYERTADVRWWATDGALFKCLKQPTEDSVGYAAERLSLINRFYTVYLNLVMTDRNGNIVTCSNPSQFPATKNADVSKLPWFKNALNTNSGDDYVVDDIYNDPLHNNSMVAVYATAIREGGKVDGVVLGVLGVFFEWEEQSRCIVQDEPNLTKDEWERSTVMLLDINNRIISSSDGNNLLQTFQLDSNQGQKGSYINQQNEIVAYAKTIGYEEYDGLGWKAVIVQKMSKGM